MNDYLSRNFEETVWNVPNSKRVIPIDIIMENRNGLQLHILQKIMRKCEFQNSNVGGKNFMDMVVLK